MMTLDDIAVPSNFLALKAIFRSMLPPEWTQRTGHPGRTISLDSPDEYIEIAPASARSERDAVRTWWHAFVAYARERGGNEIVWRDLPQMWINRDHSLDERVHSISAALFIPQGFTCHDCIPRKTFASQAELDAHVAEVERRVAEIEHLPSGDVMAESP